MKIVINKSALLEQMAAVGSIIKSKTPMPILAYVKLSAHHGFLNLLASDGSCFMTRSTSCTIIEEGVCLAPVRELREWLDNVGDDDIRLSFEDKRLVLKMAEYGVTKLSVPEAAEFPTKPVEALQFLATADMAPLKQIAWSAATPDAGRSNLEAAFVEKDKDGIICCTVDGRRFGTVLIKAELAGPEFQFSIPTQYIGLVASLGKAQISEGGSCTYFIGPDFHIAIPKPTFNPPDWKAILKKFPYTGSVTLVRDEFKAAIATCHMFRGRSPDMPDGARISLSPQDGGLRIQCDVKSADSYDNTIMARLEGEVPEIWFYTDILLPFFSLPDQSALRIDFTGSKTQCHMNAGDVNYIFLPVFPPAPKHED